MYIWMCARVLYYNCCVHINPAHTFDIDRSNVSHCFSLNPLSVSAQMRGNFHRCHLAWKPYVCKMLECRIVPYTNISTCGANGRASVHTARCHTICCLMYLPIFSTVIVTCFYSVHNHYTIRASWFFLNSLVRLGSALLLFSLLMDSEKERHTFCTAV